MFHIFLVLNQYLRLHFGTMILIMNPHFASSSWVSMTNLNHFFLVIIILLILSKTSTSLTYLVFDFILGWNHGWFSRSLDFISTVPSRLSLAKLPLVPVYIDNTYPRFQFSKIWLESVALDSTWLNTVSCELLLSHKTFIQVYQQLLANLLKLLPNL